MLKRPVVIIFRTPVDSSTLMSMRGTLKGTKIYSDDDLTIMQQEHKKESMTRVMAARDAGKWAVYRDGKVINWEKMEQRREDTGAQATENLRRCQTQRISGYNRLNIAWILMIRFGLTSRDSL